MTTTIKLAELNKQLLSRQWLAMNSLQKSSTDVIDEQLKQYGIYGTQTLQIIFADAGVTTEDFERLSIASRIDPRLDFLPRFPHIAAMIASSSNRFARSTTHDLEPVIRPATIVNCERAA